MERSKEASAAPASRRDRYTSFIERHEVAWELTMGALALVWVGLGFLLDELGSGARPELEALELVITGVFVAEFASRLYAAHDRRRYVRGHWIDAIALAPPIRAARALRLLRLLRLVRAFDSFFRAAMHLQQLASHRGFAWLIVVWLSVMAICSAFVYSVEHGGPQSAINSPFDALWWGVTTITTVGYGDTVPRTVEGRLGAMVLMVLGVGLFSAVTATITSYFVTLNQGSTPTPGEQTVQHLERLANLREDGALTQQEYEAAKAKILAST